MPGQRVSPQATEEQRGLDNRSQKSDIRQTALRTNLPALTVILTPGEESR